ncbi:hypothetical protein HPB48_025861 [Haemaphysalis longicornis]|uniref:Uncharacterized protein n=1 Tax=Haemaphysalis longicornis TaxID=44386 RepID=A0A9J6HA35_HAELO|nr:hypothetical protein HPB48_025861 [Haemaphysalis longicornis]
MCRCKQPTTGTAHNVNDGASGGTELLLHVVYLVGTEKPYEVQVQIAGKLVKGASRYGSSRITRSEMRLPAAKAAVAACECDIKLNTYRGATLKVKGQAEVLVDYNATAIPHRRRTGLHQSNGFHQLTEPA